MNRKKKTAFSVLSFWFCIFLICQSVYAKDKLNLFLTGRWRYTGSIYCVEILRNNTHSYAYCGTKGGLLILDITDLQGIKKIAFMEIGEVFDIAFYNSDYDSHKYAVLAAEKGIYVLCLHNPTAPTFAGRYDTERHATGVAISSDGRHAFVADRYNSLLVLLINETSQPQGNLILCLGGPASSENPLWAPSQAIANLVYSTFLDQHYPDYFIYYLTPDPYQDIDGDGVPDPFAIGDHDPTVADLNYTLNNWAYNRLNTGISLRLPPKERSSQTSTPPVTARPSSLQP